MQSLSFPFRKAANAGLALLLGLCAFGVREAAAAGKQVTVPANTVVYVTLDEPLTSETAVIGQKVTATTAPADLSGFPIGTRFEGIVTEVERPTATRPGILNVRWYAAVLPNPERVTLDGSPYPLSSEYAYRDEEGRLFARDFEEEEIDEDDDDGFDWKWAGYGAGAGALLSTLTGGSFLEGALFGGLGGAAYSYLRGQDIFLSRDAAPRIILAADRDDARARFQDARLAAGEPFGIRLVRPATFTMKESFRFPTRADLARDQRVLGAREELFDTTAVTIDGRPVAFGRARPINLSGNLYLPVPTVAQAAGMEFRMNPGADMFTLGTPFGPARATIGSPAVRVGEQVLRADAMPITLNGVAYAPIRFFHRVAGMDAIWRPSELRLDMATRR